MKEHLTSALAGLDADYVDIRHEDNRKTRILFRGKKLEAIAENATSGGHVRAYAKGGKATASVSDPDLLASTARATAIAAGLAGSRRAEPLRLAPRPATSGAFPIRARHDLGQLSLADKLALVSRYNDQILREPSVVSTEAEYDEFVSSRTFVTSEGQTVEYELVNVTVYGLIVTKRDGIVQRVRFAFGGCEDVSRLHGREDDLARLIAIARDLPLAQPARAGTFPVLLDPSEAGLFIHEAFGHLSEADGLQDNPDFRARLKLGTTLGGPRPQRQRRSDAPGAARQLRDRRRRGQGVQDSSDHGRQVDGTSPLARDGGRIRRSAIGQHACRRRALHAARANVEHLHRASGRAV